MVPTPKETFDALVELFVPDIRSAFLGAMQDIVDNVTISSVVAAIEQGDLEAAFLTLGFTPAAMRPITASIERAYEQGGVMIGKNFPKHIQTSNGRAVFRFDVRNSRAEAYLRDKSSTLVRELTDEARNNVRSVLQDGMTAGRNPRAVALDIVGRIDPQTHQRVGGIIGLTEHQEGWVRNTRADLLDLNENYFNRELRDKRFDRTVRKAIDTDTPLPADVIDKLVTRYKDNALKYRANTVARDQALSALNASEYEATVQAVESGAAPADAVTREWDSASDTRVRDTHAALEGQKRGLYEPFVSPLTGARMMFPTDRKLGAPAKETIQCRCRVKTVIDWLSLA